MIWVTTPSDIHVHVLVIGVQRPARLHSLKTPTLTVWIRTGVEEMMWLMTNMDGNEDEDADTLDQKQHYCTYYSQNHLLHWNCITTHFIHYVHVPPPTAHPYRLFKRARAAISPHSRFLISDSP